MAVVSSHQILGSFVPSNRQQIQGHLSNLVPAQTQHQQSCQSSGTGALRSRATRASATRFSCRTCDRTCWRLYEATVSLAFWQHGFLYGYQINTALSILNNPVALPSSVRGQVTTLAYHFLSPGSAQGIHLWVNTTTSSPPPWVCRILYICQNHLRPHFGKLIQKMLRVLISWSLLRYSREGVFSV